MDLRPGRGARQGGAVGLTATELALVVAELDGELRGHEVVDVARLADRDDLLLFLSDGDRGRGALHVALGARRARLCTTTRRFGKRAFATGPQTDRLANLLVGAHLASVEARCGERRARIAFERDRAAGPTLELELFGNRGLWCVTCADGTVAELSRLPEGAGRTLRRGAPYAPPPPGPARDDPAPRFVAPYSGAIDSHFTAQDLREESTRELDELRRVTERARRRAGHRVDGLARQLDAMEGVDAIRVRADLLLAYGQRAPRGVTSLEVPDPSRTGATITLELDPGVPVHVQAARLYDKARRYEDGRAHAVDRSAAAREELDALTHIARSLEGTPDSDVLERARAELVRRGAIAKPRPAKPPQRSKLERQVDREGFRRFTSAEGLPILVGRNNAQNDRLSIHVARGNDLWFHVGRGYAGSHVVVRLARNQNASLETLLDAATLAIHFSKVRGAELCEVIYTRAKHVSKPKGLPPGRVVATGTKALRVRLDPARLDRLLGGPNAE